jgi:hypothetical protein
MATPSTLNLSLLPGIDDLKKLAKAISTLDAIICPQWEYRYFSYQKSWDKDLGEECLEMRNGSGDHFFILFTKGGAIINGQAHESVMCNWKEVKVKSINLFKKKETVLTQFIWPGVVDTIPTEFKGFIFGEPIKSIGTTFCIWRRYSDEQWNIGNVSLPDDDYKDGSEDLLFILDNKADTYRNWAMDYYEEDFDGDPLKLDLELVEYIYNHKVLTGDIVRKINPKVEDFGKLKADLDEIGYPYELQ